MEVTIHHEHNQALEARLRKKLQLVRTALRLDRDVLDEMRNELSGFRSAFARTKALALERAASLEAENAQRFALSEVTAAGARRDVEIVRAEAEAARDAATNATKARAAGEGPRRWSRGARASRSARRTDAAKADADEAHARAPGARRCRTRRPGQRRESAAARRHNDVAAARPKLNRGRRARRGRRAARGRGRGRGPRVLR